MTQNDQLALGTRSWDIHFTLDGVAVDPTDITIVLARIEKSRKVVVDTQSKADLTVLAGVGAYRYIVIPGSSGDFEWRVTTGDDTFRVDRKVSFTVQTTIVPP